IWLCAIVGALFLALLPLLWEAWSKDPERRPRFGLFGRLVIRTVVVNLVFVAGLLILVPRVVFTSLSSRGDWMLDRADPVRWDFAHKALFRAAGGIEWVYNLVRSRPFAEYETKKSPLPQNTQKVEPSSPVSSPEFAPTAAAMRRFERVGPAWPVAETLHPS